MSDTEPIVPFRLRSSGSAAAGGAPGLAVQPRISFNRQELNIILGVYGRMVAAGEWRDYAIDHGRDKAIFSIFRRTSEMPLYKIEKNPRLAHRQGIYAVVAEGGTILRRGDDLARVLGVLVRNLQLVSV